MSRARVVVTDLWRDRFAFLAVLYLVVLLLVALLAPLVAPHDPAAQSLSGRLQPPVWVDGGDWGHPLGTDNLGRDVLSRVIHGSRVSLMVGLSVVAFSGLLGVGLGLLAGYRGGRTDAAVMRVADTQTAFPGLLLALTILAALGPSVMTVIVVLGLNGWMVYARVARATVLSVKEMPYVEAAEVVGCPPGRVVLRHIFPNLVSPVMTLAILELARIVLTEATLSFLGVGIQPPDTSWGLDVSIGKDYVYSAWWLVTFPGLAIAMTVLSVNLAASWLRVYTDPTERDKQFAALAIAAEGRGR